MNPPTDDLATRLRTADSQELAELVRSRREELGPDAVRHALRNSYVDGQVINDLLEHPRLRKYYEVRRAIAAHPRTSQTRAVGLIAGLYWRDLARIGADSRVQPVVRRAANQRLGERLGHLSVGEKVVLAREAGPGLIPRLLQERELLVLEALLDNPRLTEPLLAPLVNSPVAEPELLQRVAEDRKWGSRYAVRLALCRNPATPPELAVSLLAGIQKVDLKSIVADSRVSAAVRQRAGLLTE
jgi:hypothetical protein